jgi:hypothetical protein
MQSVKIGVIPSFGSATRKSMLLQMKFNELPDYQLKVEFTAIIAFKLK